jgi:energy-coupling factor transporter transmembrane protein EcfT
MARTAWRGNYPVYIGIFLSLSTVALLMVSMVEGRNTFVSRPEIGFILRVVLSCIASWIALICISYAMASSHNRLNLEFMKPGIHFLLEAYRSGALLYGLCAAGLNLCFARASRHRGASEATAEPLH